jgi:hypothetical protein
VQSDEVALPCLLHQICHLLPPLCLIFLLSSYASKGEKHRARAKHTSCELPKRNEQRGTKQERDERTTILQQKFTSFWYRRTGLAESAGTTDSASRIGSMQIAVHIIIPYVSMLLWTKDSIFSQSKSLVKKVKDSYMDTRGNTAPPWQAALTHVCPINK